MFSRVLGCSLGYLSRYQDIYLGIRVSKVLGYFQGVGLFVRVLGYSLRYHVFQGIGMFISIFNVRRQLRNFVFRNIFAFTDLR